MHRSIDALAAAVVGVGAILSVYLSAFNDIVLTGGACAVISVTSGAALASVVRLCGIWSAAGAFCCVAWLFHFGLIASVGLGLSSAAALSAWDQAWLLGPYGAEAALLGLGGFLALCTGTLVVRVLRGRQLSAMGTETEACYLDETGSVLGIAILLTCVATWFVVVFGSGGPGLLVGSYGDYLQQTSAADTVISAVWLFFGMGIVLTVAARDSILRRAALTALAGFVLMALPLGLRGEVFFPGVASFVALVRLRRRLPRWRMWAVVLLVLLSIPIIREVRTVGLSGVHEIRLQLKAAEALIEMGGSLHPVEKAVRWRAEGDPLLLGGSYWAPFERAAARVLPGLTRGRAEDDDRIMNVLVAQRVGFIGFSPVAEAYRNFGGVGVLVILFLLGLVVSAIDTVGDANRAVTILATIYVPLLINIRNSFVSLPAQCAISLVPVLAVLAIRHVLRAVVVRGKNVPIVALRSRSMTTKA